MSKTGIGIVLVIIVVIVIVLVARPNKQAEMLDDMPMEEEMMETESSTSASTSRGSSTTEDIIRDQARPIEEDPNDILSGIDAIIEDDLLSEDELGSVFSDTSAVDGLSDVEYGF